MFRLTIRDLLWLMVVVGLGLGWYANSADASRLAYLERWKRHVEKACYDEGIFIWDRGRRGIRLFVPLHATDQATNEMSAATLTP